MNKDLKSGAFTITRRNVESNAVDIATQHKDFRELLANWKSDSYLLDQMERGLYVKRRAVSIEKNALVWSETAIFSDITKLIPNFNLNDTLRFPLHDTTGLIITTNGVLSTSPEGAAIKWNPYTTTFSVTTRMREFNPTSSFAGHLRHYLKR
ncbi:MAG TPA: hypothetical protein VJ508_00740 [Saprospiraceae bacterium]|nr:hypothetical protein [Saprospiraceae bacterium]